MGAYDQWGGFQGYLDAQRGYAYGPNGTRIYNSGPGYAVPSGAGGNDLYAFQWGRGGQSAEPSAAITNEYLKYFNLTGGGLTSEQEAALKASGNDTGLDAVRQWQQSARDLPFSLDNQVGIANLVMNEARYRESLGINTLQQQLAQSQLNQTGQFLYNNMNDVLGQYDTARNELDMAGQGAITGLLSRERQAIASTQQNLQSRGLGSSSVLDNARQGIQRRTSQDIAQVREDVGGQRSALAERRGQAQQSLGANMADFMKYRTATEQNILQNRQGLIGSVQNQYQGNSQQAGGDKNNAQSALGFFAAAAPIIAALI